MKWLPILFFIFQLPCKKITITFLDEGVSRENPIKGKVYYTKDYQKMALHFPQTGTEIKVDEGSIIHIELWWNGIGEGDIIKEYWFLEILEKAPRLEYYIQFASLIQAAQKTIFELRWNSPKTLEKAQYLPISLRRNEGLIAFQKAAFFRRLNPGISSQFTSIAPLIEAYFGGSSTNMSSDLSLTPSESSPHSHYSYHDDDEKPLSATTQSSETSISSPDDPSFLILDAPKQTQKSVDK